MEEQLQNIRLEMTRMKMHLDFFSGILAFEIAEFGKILSKEVDDKFTACLEKYMILEEERSFLEYVLTKTD